MRGAPRERREGSYLTKVVSTTDLVFSPQLGLGDHPGAWPWELPGGWVNGLFFGDTPRSQKLLRPQISLGWLRQDRGCSTPCSAACRAACAQPALVLPEKPAAPSCEEKAHGVTEVPEKMCCLTCGQVFGSREEQVSRTEQSEVGAGLA